jgi:hypothetical protein
MTASTRSSIFIDAPPSAVMDVIADFPGYPQWVTAVKQVEVLELLPSGRARVVRFVLDAGVVADDYALAYTWADDGVSWRLVRGTTIKAMDGSYRLSPSGDGTDVEYELSVDIDLPLLAVMRRKAEQVLIEVALRALKARVEA